MGAHEIEIKHVKVYLFLFVYFVGANILELCVVYACRDSVFLDA